jgi:hypothetical protein
MQCINDHNICELLSLGLEKAQIGEKVRDFQSSRRDPGLSQIEGSVTGVYFPTP